MAELDVGSGIELLQQRAKFVKALLIAGLVLVVAMLAGEIAEYAGIIDLEEIDQSPLAQLYAATALFSVVVTIVTFIAFAMWIYRAAANVVAAEVSGFEYSAGWAVGWYFIPIANLVKPFHAMRQIWNASHGQASNALNHGNPLLTIWWTTWLISNIANNISARLSLRADTVSEAQFATMLGIVGSLVSLILYSAALRLVDRITTAQRDRLTAAHIFA